MASNSWHSLAKRAARCALVAAAFGWNDCNGFSQAPQSAPVRPAAARRTFTKNTTFSLPLHIEESVRGSLSEVRLYVKTGGHDWSLHEAASPSSLQFTCKAPSDGEYQFLLVTVDQAGLHSPAELSGQSPVLRVIVDTRPPVLEPVAVSENGVTTLRVSMVDANPDLKSIQAFAINDRGERALAPVPGVAGAFQLHPSDLTNPIRVTGMDLSGNLATRVVSPREILETPLAAAASNTAQPASSLMQPSTPKAQASLPASSLPTVNTASSPLPPPQIINGAPIKLTTPTVPTPPATEPTVRPATLPPATALAAPSTPMPIPVSPPTPLTTGNVVASYRPAVLPERTDDSSNKQNPGIINYKIEASAPASIGRIDITLTPERGGAPKVGADESVATEDAKKLIAERDEARAQLAQRNREREEMNIKFAERAKEIADLRAQLAVKTQERNHLAQELQQIPLDLQAILKRVEGQTGSSLTPAAAVVPATTIAPAASGPTLPMLPEPNSIRKVE
jgi:hypothetical protein